MDPLLAAALKDCRNSYDYPGALVVQTGRADRMFQTSCMPFAFDDCVTFAVTTVLLDATFTDLLRSPEPIACRRGVACVLYWGFYAFGPEYARRRVAWLLEPCRGRGEALASEETVKFIADAVAFVNEGEFGRALGAVGGISQLSRTPFASKVVAFLSPGRVGIYDNRIRKALEAPQSIGVAPIAQWVAAMVDAYDISRGVGQVREPRVQQRFVNWCGVLAQTADELNELGEGAKWADPQAGPQVWRAMDVERAVFQAAARRAPR